MELEPGDMIVVPGCGIGRVEQLETIDMGGTEVEVYRINLGEANGQTWIPTHRIAVDGARRPMSMEQVEATWKLIGDQEAPEKRGPWNQRQRRYQEELLSNDPERLATLLGELGAVRRAKPLSFKEQVLHDKVRDMLVAEIAAVNGKPTEVVLEHMERVLDAPS